MNSSVVSEEGNNFRSAAVRQKKYDFLRQNAFLISIGECEEESPLKHHTGIRPEKGRRRTHDHSNKYRTEGR